MNANHTPGPWEVHGATIVWSPIAKATIAAASELRAESYVAFQMPSISSADFDEACANARLIAAAPELLMALQMLYDETADYIRLNNLGGMDNQCMRLARAAIAAATSGVA